MADVRHWGLALIWILYTAWQRGIFAGIFAPVYNDNMSTQFFCAQSCTASIFGYMIVRALTKCNLFQPVYTVKIKVCNKIYKKNKNISKNIKKIKKAKFWMIMKKINKSKCKNATWTFLF